MRSSVVPAPPVGGLLPASEDEDPSSMKTIASRTSPGSWETCWAICCFEPVNTRTVMACVLAGCAGVVVRRVILADHPHRRLVVGFGRVDGDGDVVVHRAHPDHRAGVIRWRRGGA